MSKYANLIDKKFMTRGKKDKRICTVVDIFTTRNMKNEIVQTEILATHDFLGQKVLNRYPVATIMRGMID